MVKRGPLKAPKTAIRPGGIPGPHPPEIRAESARKLSEKEASPPRAR